MEMYVTVKYLHFLKISVKLATLRFPVKPDREGEMSKHGFRLVAIAMASLACVATAPAQTMSYADAVTTLADDCGADILKLCKGLNLGNGRIADCLQQNAAKVSATCKGSLSIAFRSIAQREQAQASYDRLCARDKARLCLGIKGDGFILACLAKKEQRVSAGCNQAITDAGWR